MIPIAALVAFAFLWFAGTIVVADWIAKWNARPSDDDRSPPL